PEPAQHRSPSAHASAAPATIRLPRRPLALDRPRAPTETAMDPVTMLPSSSLRSLLLFSRRATIETAAARRHAPPCLPDGGIVSELRRGGGTKSGRRELAKDAPGGREATRIARS